MSPVEVLLVEAARAEATAARHAREVARLRRHAAGLRWQAQAAARVGEVPA